MGLNKVRQDGVPPPAARLGEGNQHGEQVPQSLNGFF